MISIIAAIGKNNELGKKNELLWNLPADMQHFRDITRGHTVIMGQKTFESIGRPLPNRRNIVVTRSDSFTYKGIEISKSLEDTIQSFKNANEEVFVIGGGEIYRQTINEADKLYITHVKENFPEADVFFPKIDSSWKEISREKHEPDEKNAWAYAFSIYEKI